MAEASIKARIAADGQQFLSTLKNLEAATTAWATRTTQVVATQSSKTAKTVEGVATAGAKFKSTGAQNALLDFSRAFEDAQYGMQGVLNNLPGIATQLGAGAGLTGVISIAAVAIYQLSKGFGAFISNAKNIKEATDEVAKLDTQLKSVTDKLAAAAKEAWPTNEDVKQAKAWKDEIELADEALKRGNAALEARAARTAAAAKSQLGADLEKVAVSDATPAKKIIQSAEIQEKALLEAHKNEEARVKSDIALRNQRFAVTQKQTQGVIENAKRQEEQARAIAENSKARDEEQLAIQQRINTLKDELKTVPVDESTTARRTQLEVEIAREQAKIETEKAAKDRRDIAGRAESEARIAAGKRRDALETQRREEGQLRDTNFQEEARMATEKKALALDLATAKSKAERDAETANLRAFELEAKNAEALLDEQKKEDALEQKQKTRLHDQVQSEQKRLAVLQQINREHKEALGDLQKEARIKGLREQGRDTQADREERAVKVQQRARQIHDLGQTTPSQSMQLAMQLEGGGRGRVRSTGRHRQAGGIDEVTEVPKGTPSNAEQRRIERHLEKMEKSLSGKRDDKGDPVPREK